MSEITKAEMVEGLFAMGAKYLAIADEMRRDHEAHDGLCEMDLAQDMGTLASVMAAYIELLRDE